MSLPRQPRGAGSWPLYWTPTRPFPALRKERFALRLLSSRCRPPWMAAIWQATTSR